MAISSILQLPSRWTKLKLEQMKSERRNSYIKKHDKTFLFQMFLAKKICTSINNLNGILDGFPEGHDLLIALLQKQYPSFFFKGNQEHIAFLCYTEKLSFLCLRSSMNARAFLLFSWFTKRIIFPAFSAKLMYVPVSPRGGAGQP